jgi:tRNA(Leu) C34 or U34 (ribose-2'-O)-methylase TrmL
MRSNIFKDVERFKKQLEEKAERGKFCENFGQKELMELKDKWRPHLYLWGQETTQIIQRKLDEADDFAMNFVPKRGL